MSNSGISPAVPLRGTEPATYKTHEESTRRRVSTNRVSVWTMLPSVEPVVAISSVPSYFLVGWGLCTVFSPYTSSSRGVVLLIWRGRRCRPSWIDSRIEESLPLLLVPFILTFLVLSIIFLLILLLPLFLLVIQLLIFLLLQHPLLRLLVITSLLTFNKKLIFLSIHFSHEFVIDVGVM